MSTRYDRPKDRRSGTGAIGRRVSAAVIVVLAAACASAPQTPSTSARSLTGQYTFEFDDGPDTFEAVLTVIDIGGGLDGTIEMEGRPTMQATSVTGYGPSVVVTADLAVGLLVLRMEVRSDGAFDGDWTLGDSGGGLTGQWLPNR